jgi:hypothetical protein
MSWRCYDVFLFIFYFLFLRIIVSDCILEELQKFRPVFVNVFEVPNYASHQLSNRRLDTLVGLRNQSKN